VDISRLPVIPDIFSDIFSWAQTLGLKDNKPIDNKPTAVELDDGCFSRELSISKLNANFFDVKVQ
jgi:hypothetical protein